MFTRYLFFLTISTISLIGCGSDAASSSTQDENIIVSPHALSEIFIAQGLTCEVQTTLLAFDDEQSAEFVAIVKESLADAEIAAAVEQREREYGHGAEPIPNEDGIGETSQAINGSYKVQQIPEASNGAGSYATAIYRDSAAYDGMCGSNHQPDYPADYIAQFHVSGGYVNRASLRIYGTSPIASCFVSNPTDTRVYTDDDARSCIGYWSVYFCNAGYPAVYTSDMKMWR